MTKAYWNGPKPTKCATCTDPLETAFVDGCLYKGGQWACLCLRCNGIFGCGLGLGRGQQYEKQEDGKWLKTAG